MIRSRQVEMGMLRIFAHSDGLCFDLRHASPTAFFECDAFGTRGRPRTFPFFFLMRRASTRRFG